ncbi:MAG TPA: ATP-binding protein [Allosphingosinicella sp.]
MRYTLAPELDFRLLRPGAPGEQLELMIRDLGRLKGFEVEWTGRGPDGGRDLVFIEKLTGALSEQRVRWLVQCKDLAQSGRSVTPVDVGSILDIVAQHKADGFLLATTTIPSSGLKSRLDSLDLSKGGPIRTLVWDAAELLHMLRTDEARQIAAIYFPSRNLESERILHGVISSLAALSGNLHFAEHLLDQASTFEPGDKVREALKESLALVDDLHFQFEGPRVGEATLAPADTLVLDDRFWSRIRRRAESFAYVHNSPPVKFVITQPDALRSQRIVGAERTVERVLLELVSNAIRYRKPKNVPQIHILLRRNESHLSILVRSLGIGIEPHDADHVFELGFRGHNAMRVSLRGSGIGLSTARALLHEIGGDIRLVSAQEWTSFEVLLPIGKSA